MSLLWAGGRQGAWGTTSSNSAGRAAQCSCRKRTQQESLVIFLGYGNIFIEQFTPNHHLLGDRGKCHGVKPDSSNSYFGKGGPVSNNTLQSHNAQCFSRKPIYIHYLLNPTWPPVHNGEPEMWETEDVGPAGGFLVSPPTPLLCPTFLPSSGWASAQGEPCCPHHSTL